MKNEVRQFQKLLNSKVQRLYSPQKNHPAFLRAMQEYEHHIKTGVSDTEILREGIRYVENCKEYDDIMCTVCSHVNSSDCNECTDTSKFSPDFKAIRRSR